ncbi:MAG: hypothetical protein WDO73_06515 [Ignavibacteriota bacterium]
MRGPLRTLMIDTLSADNWHRGLFDPAGLQHFVNSHLERRANLGYELWGLMLLLLWIKRWEFKRQQHWPPRRFPRESLRLHRRRPVAAAIYLGCILSPPSLMDDVDAVQAQIARNICSRAIG